MLGFESFTSYKSYRYLKIAGGLSLALLAIYIWDEPEGGSRGDSALGYFLGVLGALLIFWLTSLGYRKRNYLKGSGNLAGWLSAHVFLGYATLFIATLHTGLNFHWLDFDIHSACWIALVLVVLTGHWGLMIYRRVPTRMSALMDGRGLTELLQLLDDIDAESISLASRLGPEFQTLIATSAAAPVSRGWRGRLQRNAPWCPTTAAVRRLEALDNPDSPDIRALLLLQVRRQQQIQKLRAYLRNKVWSQIWLLFHVPLTLALLALLIGHVVVQFWYW